MNNQIEIESDPLYKPFEDFFTGHSLEIRFDGELIMKMSYDSTVKRPSNDAELRKFLQDAINAMDAPTVPDPDDI